MYVHTSFSSDSQLLFLFFFSFKRQKILFQLVDGWPVKESNDSLERYRYGTVDPPPAVHTHFYSIRFFVISLSVFL